MATTVGHSAAEPRRPVIVGFTRPPFSLPVQAGELMRWGLIVLVLANLGRIPVLGTGDREAAIVLNDVCVTAIVAFCLVAAFLRRSLLIDSVAGAALAFAAVGLGSALLAVPRFGLTPFELFVSLSYLIRWVTYFGVFLFVINNVKLDQVSGIWEMLVRVMLVFSVFGIFQSLFLPGFAQIVYPESRDYIDWDPQGHRLVSTVLEPNIAASMIVLVLLVQLAQIAVGAKVKVWQPVVFLLALTLTLSRSGLLGLVSGLVVILLVRGISVRLMKLFGAILFLSIALIPRLLAFAQMYSKFDVGEGTSAGTRVLAWLLALETIGEHPIIGVGFNTYGYYKASKGMVLRGAATYGSDGGLLFAMVMTGAVGLILYLAMLWFVMRRSRRIWRDESISAEHRGLAIGVAAGVVAVVVHSLFVNSMFTTFVMEMIWVTWGLTFVIARESPPAERRLARL
jgi:O-antigen ligase